MRTKVYVPPNMPGVILRIPRGRPDAHHATITVPAWTQQVAPGMPVRHLDTPAQRFRILNSLFNVLVGMARPAHLRNPILGVDKCQHERKSSDSCSTITA